MTSLRRSLLLGVLLALVAMDRGQTQEAPPRPMAVDAQGDPLPEDAVARLGTIRFRSGTYLRSVALSPDGKTLAVFGDGRGIVLLDAATGKEQRRINNVGNGSSLDITGMTFSPDGKSLIHWGYNAIVVRDLATGNVIHSHQGQQMRNGGCSLSADSKILAAGAEGYGRKTPAIVMDLSNGKQLAQITALQDSTVFVALTPDGKNVATWGQHSGYNAKGNDDRKPEYNRTVQLWDVASGKELRQLVGPSHRVAAAAFSPDGKLLATGDGASSVTLWDAAEGKEIRRFIGRRGLGIMIRFSPDGKTLAAACQGGAVQLFEVATGKRLGQCDPRGNVYGLVFTADGQAIAWAVDGQSVILYDVYRDKPLVPEAGHRLAVTAVRFTGDGKSVVSLGADSRLITWDAATGRERAKTDIRDEETERMYGRLAAYQSAGVMSPDGRYLIHVSQYTSAGVVLRELPSGREVCQFPMQIRSTGRGLGVAFSPDGRFLAAGGGDPYVNPNQKVENPVILWEIETGKQAQTLKTPGGGVLGLAISPDGKTIAASSSALDQGKGRYVGTLQIWDTATGAEKAKVQGLPTPAQLLTFSPDGASLALACQDGTLRILDVASGKETRQFTGAVGLAAALVFSPDGRLLITAHLDPTTSEPRLHVWETLSASLRFTLKGHLGPVTCLAVSPDGRYLASGSQDTTVLVWDLEARLPRVTEAPAKLADAQKVWEELANPKADIGWKAMLQLMASPADTAALIRKELPPAEDKVPGPDELARLVTELDSDDFAQREQASRSLRQVGPPARQVLEKAVKDNISLEMVRRARNLLEDLDRANQSWTLVRPLRAVEVLERIGNSEARQVLEGLAGGQTGARQTVEAKAALERIARRAAGR